MSVNIHIVPWMVRDLNAGANYDRDLSRLVLVRESPCRHLACLAFTTSTTGVEQSDVRESLSNPLNSGLEIIGQFG